MILPSGQIDVMIDNSLQLLRLSSVVVLGHEAWLTVYSDLLDRMLYWHLETHNILELLYQYKSE